MGDILPFSCSPLPKMDGSEGVSAYSITQRRRSTVPALLASDGDTGIILRGAHAGTYYRGVGADMGRLARE